MSITSPKPQRRPLAAKLALVSTVSLGLLAGPVAFAGPASASADYGKDGKNCHVTAYKPYKADNDSKPYKADNGKKDKDRGKSVKVVFKFKIHCDKATKVYFDHKMFQNNGRKDKDLGRDRGWVWVHGDKYFDSKEKVSFDRHDKEVKVSHTVKIQFKDKDRHGHWTWKSDSDKAHATIKVDKERGY